MRDGSSPNSCRIRELGLVSSTNNGSRAAPAQHSHPLAKCQGGFLGDAGEKRALLCTHRGLHRSVAAVGIFFPLSHPPFCPPGSPTTAGSYGGRRSFPAELDFHGTKQFGSDVYPSPLGSKPFSCDSSAPQGYPALLEPYLSEQFGDHRAPPLPAAASSFFSAPAVPPLLPSFPSDAGHFLLREPWEQTSAESLSQGDSACSELPASSSCLSLPEPGAASPFRGSGWTPALPGAQPYPLHPLEDAHYSPSYAAPSPYSLSPFVAVASETSRMSHPCPEQPSEPPHLPEHSAWPKEDGSALWGTYEVRRTY
ncbi:hypothetical protein DV515_00015090 [Chloebia gouldiae]|uniref:Uncharacterized protein n=1 Tax=Chloebia gouldiae TaxID=44316 RepID=A0A3L8RW94_CHLGU|nr:hypothetical protein DV515_00015090 [Chloebia gouldiae]